MRCVFTGEGVSPGIAVGKVFKWRHEPAKSASRVETRSGSDDSPDVAKNAWRQAVEAASRALLDLADSTASSIGDEQAEIFRAHDMILRDPVLEDMVFSRIDSGRTLEQAIAEAFEALRAQFESMDNEYMRERALDIADIGLRVLNLIRGTDTAGDAEGVVVAEDLAPSETGILDPSKVKAIILEAGGPTGHSVILAQALGIPAIIKVPGIVKRAREGEPIMVDGKAGIAVLNPSAEEIALAQDRMSSPTSGVIADLSLATTRDGAGVEIAANAGTPQDIHMLRKHGLRSIGLCRTEFLLIGRDVVPSEEEQYREYSAMVAALNPHTACFRSFDVGGDKEFPCIPNPPESNPFLGVRAIRLGFERPELMKTQIRALLRSSIHGRVRIVFPMVATIGEWRALMELVRSAKAELDTESIRYSEDIQLGAMVEIPSAALIADKLAREADFMSIGTNDLIQYTLAADRSNPRLRHLYQPLHPAVLKLIYNCTVEAHGAGKWVGVCGEAAGEREVVPVLIGLGVDELSMTPSRAPAIHALIESLSMGEMQDLAMKALRCESEEEVLALVRAAAPQAVLTQ
ncbi:MAG: phosphoenolpyruvate--protein phosphotransferase [Firmicutes bacterium]|jgi:phosphotransferase system enzyme I (PtsI)|nr:phosphoenolpyruvate--protein phosphotransferase [Bacillota bacterium]